MRTNRKMGTNGCGKVTYLKPAKTVRTASAVSSPSLRLVPSILPSPSQMIEDVLVSSLLHASLEGPFPAELHDTLSASKEGMTWRNGQPTGCWRAR